MYQKDEMKSSCAAPRSPLCDSGRLVATGFTLIELTVVLMIIAILAVVSVPKFFDSMSFHRADSAARRIKADLELARKHAMVTSSDRTVSFQVGNDRYELSPFVPNLDHPTRNYSVELSGQPYYSSVITADFGGDNIVVFNGFGIPDSGGTVVIRHKNEERSIFLDAATGQVLF